MKVLTYRTSGGKDKIKEYLLQLDKVQRAEGFSILEGLEVKGKPYLDSLNTRPLREEVFEIKFSQQRFMYVLYKDEKIYILHVCKKQKGKAEKLDINIALQRAKEI